MALLKKINAFFDRLAELWRTNAFIKSTRSLSAVIWNGFLLTLSVLVIGCFFAVGTVAGLFAALVQDQQVPSFEDLNHRINDYGETSTAYFAGDVLIGKMSNDLERDKIELKDVSPHLIHAVIATEDENFYQHKGFVPKGVLRATSEELLNKPQVTGGSTITQQLIKMQVLSNEVSLDRKAKEILLAMRAEKYFTKDQILEAYLNVSPFGRNASGNNIAGVSAAAEGIFGVKAGELNIAQAAFIAGLPKNPFVYSPFKNHGGTKEDFSEGIDRAHTVLQRMYAAGFIDKTQLTDALKYDYREHLTKPEKSFEKDYPYVRKDVEERAKIVFAKMAADRSGYDGDRLYDDYLKYKNMVFEKDNRTFHTDNLEEIAEKYHDYDYQAILKNYSLFEELLKSAETEIAEGGYEIHTTINKELHDAIQNAAASYSGYSEDKFAKDSKGRFIETVNDETGEKERIKDPMQVGAVLIENKTGKILGFAGGRDYNRSEYNYALDVPRQNGSTMKPLLVYAPAMELGLIQPGSIVADLPQQKRNGWAPKNYGGGFHGFETARVALAQSHNVPAVSVFERLLRTTDTTADYLTKNGITTLVGSDGRSPANALGGISRGITVEETTNAYTAFANSGMHVDAYMIDKIVDGSGNIVYQHQPKPVRVYSEETSYMMIDMMRDVFKSGTARATPGMLNFSSDWAGKTGTSQEWRDSWLIGSNPNVTLGVWNGYAHTQSLNTNLYSSQTRTIWARIANDAYAVDPDLMDPEERFEQPESVVTRTFCGLTGGQVTEMCQAAGFAKTDLVNLKYLPKEKTEVLEPILTVPETPQQTTPEKEENPNASEEEKDRSDNEQQPSTAPAETTGYRFKAEAIRSLFPYLDADTANSGLRGRK